MLKVINFQGTCTARERLTLVSKLIKYPFRTKSFLVTFASGCNNLMQITAHSSLDSSAPTTEAPNDFSLFAENSNNGYLVGNAEQKILQHEVEIPDSGTYLKIHAYNEDYYDHAINVQVTIEPLIA